MCSLIEKIIYVYELDNEDSCWFLRKVWKILGCLELSVVIFIRKYLEKGFYDLVMFIVIVGDYIVLVFYYILIVI